MTMQEYLVLLESEMTKPLRYFPEVDAQETADALQAYRTQQLRLWVGRIWKKRLAKKLLKRTPYRGRRKGQGARLLYEARVVSAQILGMIASEYTRRQLQEDGFARRILSPVHEEGVLS